MGEVNLPYGIDDFEKVRTSGCYYIDKTGFIRELLGETFSVNLITRPRRFGKTLTMRMLTEFLDIRKDNEYLFEGLEIARESALCAKWMNQWPVLFLTLKDVAGKTFDRAYGLLEQVIAKLCIEHIYLRESDKTADADREIFLRLMYRRGDDTDVLCALDTLLRMMKAHFGRDVVLLIDEYDVPLAKAGENGFYEEMLDVIRIFLGMAWKSNPSLKFAVVTGCLRIAKESIFTGANNFLSNSLLDEHYNQYFGFTEQEVRGLLRDAHAAECLPDMKRWYDGYRFGGREVYCPWDVINHVRALMKNRKMRPGSYWKDTSHNHIIRRLIDVSSNAVKGKIETLLAGGIIKETIVEDLNYDNADDSEDNLWSILLLTGYLTQAVPDPWQKTGGNPDGRESLRIPNEEVKALFADTVKAWFVDKMESGDRREFFREWWNGEDEKLTRDVTDILFDTISYFDYREDYYHAFLAGLFSGAGYEVRSNSEQGTGRADIVVTDRRHRQVIVIEAKWSSEEGSLEAACRAALRQTEEKQYARRFLVEGYEKVLCYGAAFRGKNCMVRLAGRDGAGGFWEIN